MYKQDLALNNQQELICHKTQPTNIYVCLCVPIMVVSLYFKTLQYTL